ncbi:MAG: tyrosine-type recombinase/integrase [Clostridia bacterium]|nr:tyrosine-type recombinase/integrase [Clostridia bacterium]
MSIDENGKQVRRRKYGFRTKKEALDYLMELRFKPQKDSRIKSLYEALAPQIEKLSKDKQSHYKTAFNRMQVLHNQKIEVLSVQDLQTVVDENCPTKYPAKDMRDLFSLLYQRAMSEQIVSVNLSKFIVLPSSEETETTPLNEKEIEALWKDFTDGNTLTGCFLLMCYTGTMPGELFKITPANIDLTKKRITGAGIKTEKRKETPTILPDIIIPVVEELIKDKPQNERLWTGDEKSFYDYFAEMKKRCELREEIRPYSCRHTLATVLKKAKVDVEHIKEIMRHSKTSTTEHYIHLEKDQSAEAQAMNSALT